jgi:hypothetical protein
MSTVKLPAWRIHIITSNQSNYETAQCRMRPVTVVMKYWAEKRCLRNIPSPESHNSIHWLKSFEFTSRIARPKNKLNAESWWPQAFWEKHDKPVPADIPPSCPRNAQPVFLTWNLQGKLGVTTYYPAGYTTRTAVAANKESFTYPGSSLWDRLS